MKLYLIILCFIIFNPAILFYSGINSSVENKNTNISLFLKSNKTFCSPINDEIVFEVSINNQSIIPKIKKISCTSLYKWYQYMVVLNIVHNEEKYMFNYSEGKCGTPSLAILIKGIPILMSEKVKFKNLVKRNDTDFLTRKNNTDYGIYSIQAAYILKKDTIYSNKIIIEYKKE